MSFTDEADTTISETAVTEVTVSYQPGYSAIAQFSLDGDAVECQQTYHGYMAMPPGAHATFAYDDDDTENGAESANMDFDKRKAWQADYALETPTSLKESGDEDDLQGWTYVADYTLHPATPYVLATKLYLHARIRYDGAIQFGMFEEVQKNSVYAAHYPLSLITAEDDSYTEAQVSHGYRVPPLRIASKEEAEGVLITKEGKLIIAAAPKCLGALMNSGYGYYKAKYSDDSLRRMVIYYGHLWVYFGAIIDNVLYIAGLPIYKGEDTGHVKSTIGGTTSYYDINLPPTYYDLYDEKMRGAFYEAYKSIYGEDENGDWESALPIVSNIFDKYGDADTACVVACRPLALITLDNGSYTCQQVWHGYISADTVLIGGYGGAYALGSEIVAADADDVSYSYKSTSWHSSRGASGFVPTKCAVGNTYTSKGYARVQYVCQGFFVKSTGKTYSIRTTSFYTYSPEEDEDGYETLDSIGSITITDTHSSATTEDEEEDEDEGTGGGGAGHINDDEEDEDESSSIGGVGNWFTAGTGVKVTGPYRVEPASSRVLQFGIEITGDYSQSIEDIKYAITGIFSVSGGGVSYTVQGGSNSMNYYIKNQSYYEDVATDNGVISVCNQTTYVWRQDTDNTYKWAENELEGSDTEYPLADVTVTGTAKAVFKKMYIKSSDDFSTFTDCNIFKLEDVGTVSSNDRIGVIVDGKRVWTKAVFSYFKYRVSVNEDVVNQILKNTLISKLGDLKWSISPKSVTGTVTGSCGAPTVKAEDVEVELKSELDAISGATEVEGSYSMTVQGTITGFKGTWTIDDRLTGWNEGDPGKRQSGEISGTFTLAADDATFTV